MQKQAAHLLIFALFNAATENALYDPLQSRIDLALCARLLFRPHLDIAVDCLG